MTSRQEKGVQRLYRWTVDACRSTSSGSGMTPMDSDLLPVAVSHLQKTRPSLIQDVIDEYCQARRTFLTRSFLDALTLGGMQSLKLYFVKTQSFLTSNWKKYHAFEIQWGTYFVNFST